MSAAVVDPPAGPQDLFLGYDPAELAVFDRFAGRRFAPEPGFITDFLGVRTRASFLAGHAAPDVSFSACRCRRTTFMPTRSNGSAS